MDVGDGTTVPPAHPPMNFDDLILSHHTMRHATFEERVAAAAEAGCAGIGVSGPDLARLLASGVRLGELAAVLRHYDQQVLELEALRGWSARGEEAHDWRAEDRFYEISEILGPAHHLQAIGSYSGDVDQAAEGFAALCDRAAEHGLLVALEFIPEFTNIADIATATAITTRAARANGGICFDTWHYVRGPSDDEQLRELSAETIVAVQLDDGTLQPGGGDYLTDTMTSRMVPGEGEFPLVDLLHTLHARGVRRPISLEVISTALDAEPPAAVARRVVAGARDVIRQAVAL